MPVTTMDAATTPPGASAAEDASRESRRRTPARLAQPSPYSDSRLPTDDDILGLADQSPSAPNGSADVECGGLEPPLSSVPAGPDGAGEAGLAHETVGVGLPDSQADSRTPQPATPDSAALLADLDRMDALFFSRRPEDHAALARAVASLDPAAFLSLAQAMNLIAQEGKQGDVVGASRNLGTAQSAAHPDSSVIPNPAASFADGGEGSAVTLRDQTRKQIPASSAGGPRTASRAPAAPGSNARGFARDDNTRGIGSPVEGQGFSPAEKGMPAGQSALPQAVAEAPPERQIASPSAAQLEFFHAANSAAVQGVLDAIEAQVGRLLPEGVSKSARNRVVGEIYRELDTTLQSNRQLAQQVRDAFRSGGLDADHQRAIVSLVTGRARQALPGVARRVLNEWTSTVVAANEDRRARQRAAERRVDIAGSGRAGNDGLRPMTPSDLDYSRLSDADILNL